MSAPCVHLKRPNSKCVVMSCANYGPPVLPGSQEERMAQGLLDLLAEFARSQVWECVRRHAENPTLEIRFGDWSAEVQIRNVQYHGDE